MVDLGNLGIAEPSAVVICDKNDASSESVKKGDPAIDIMCLYR